MSRENDSYARGTSAVPKPQRAAQLDECSTMRDGAAAYPAPAYGGAGTSPPWVGSEPNMAPRKLSRLALDNALRNAQSRLAALSDELRRAKFAQQDAVQELICTAERIKSASAAMGVVEDECAEFASALENYKG